ncbi:MAG: arylesterase [Bdellovibrionaceae bacterium]|nr:arylesterase [Pseudobdellovibrionaceae bacterium]
MFIILLLSIFLVPLPLTSVIPYSRADEALSVVILGDSLTEGYGVKKEDSYPALIEGQLRHQFPNLKIINAAISGSTSASGPSRLKWQLRNKPQLLVLALGANDGLRGLSTDSLKTNLQKTIEIAQKNNIPVILLGMQMPVNYGKTYTQKYATVFSDLAKKYQLRFVPFLLEGVALKKELNQSDGIHPNEKGYKIIASRLTPIIEDAIKKMEKSSKK